MSISYSNWQNKLIVFGFFFVSLILITVLTYQFEWQRQFSVIQQKRTSELGKLVQNIDKDLEHSIDYINAIAGDPRISDFLNKKIQTGVVSTLVRYQKLAKFYRISIIDGHEQEVSRVDFDQGKVIVRSTSKKNDLSDVLAKTRQHKPNGVHIEFHTEGNTTLMQIIRGIWLNGKVIGYLLVEMRPHSVISEYKFLVENFFLSSREQILLSRNIDVREHPAIVNTIYGNGDKKTLYQGKILIERLPFVYRDDHLDSRQSFVLGSVVSVEEKRSISQHALLKLIPVVAGIVLFVTVGFMVIRYVYRIRDRAEGIIHDIAVGISEVGSSFFVSLVKNLGLTLKVDYVLIGQLVEFRKVQTVAIYSKGTIADNFEYDLTGTPCEKITDSETHECQYWGNVTKIFPEDKILQNMNVDTYIGTKLTDSNGNVIGLIALMHNFQRKRLNKDFAQSLLKIFAARVGAELERKLIEDTLLKSRREAQLANQAKDRFLAKMNHEFRTPLNGVIGMIDLLSTTSIDEEQQEYIDVLKSSSKLLLSIISNTLDFAKIESGSYVPNPRSLDFRKFLEKTIKPLKIQATENGLSFQFSVSDRVEDFVEIDELVTWQILNNLIGNAIKYTQQGGVKLEVSNKPGYLTFVVEDSGIGISQNDQEAVFEPFCQIEKNREIMNGSGLGLSITKKLLDHIDGKITLHSEVGIGSRFTVEIPYLSTSKLPARVEECFQDKDDSHDLSLLVVEDNRTNQLLLRKMLEKAGYKIDMAEDGESAVEMCSERSYDLILMDVQLPMMDGIAASQAIRKLENKEKEIPIIAITALATEDDRERCLKGGMNDYLSKPIQRLELLQCVERWTNV